jgi:hypothetical protein
MKIRISKPSISVELGVAYYRAVVSSEKLTSNIEFSVSEEFKEFLTPSCDPLLVAVLAPAMSVGADIEIGGPVSPDLLSAARRAVQAVMICNKPHLNNIRIDHKGQEHIPNVPRHCIATGFSAGIDSMCAVYDYLIEASGPHERITHLISNNFSQNKDIAEWERRRTRKAAEEFGCPLIEVNSNIDVLSSPPWVEREFQAVGIHTLWNSSVALALQGGVSRFYYSSTFSYQSLHYHEADDIAFIDPELLRLLSTSAIRLCSIGSEYSRVEKTRHVRRLPQSRSFLNVCFGRGGAEGDWNCGRCEKCKRTLLTLELTGGTKEFERVFDLAAWRETRDAYMADLMFRNDPFSQELRELLREAGEKIPKGRLFSAGARRTKGFTVKTARRVAKKVLPAPLIRTLKTMVRT